MNLEPFLVKLFLVQTSEQNNIENFSPSALEKETFPTVSPDNPPWHWSAALGMWLVSVILLIAVPSIVVIPYIMSKGVNLNDADALKNFLTNDYGAVLLQIGLVIPIHAVTFALSWALVTNFKKYPFRKTVGWEWGGFHVWHVAVIIIGFFLLAYGLVFVFGEQENELTKILKSSRAAVYIIAFLATFTAPVVEEVVYRGIIYSAFQKAFGVVFAVFVATILFAGVHYFQYWGDFTALILVTLLSLILTLIRVQTGNLLPCIVLHTIFNGIQSILLLLEPYLREQVDKIQQAATIFYHLK